MSNHTIPEKGLCKEDVLAELRAYGEEDADWRGGKTWSLVYFAGDEVLEVIKEAYGMYISTNGLSPFAFPSLRRFEEEVVAMAADLLGGDGETVGTMTSGGTESILMAVKTARDKMRAERPDIVAPEMILPVTVHPAFQKAAHYLGVKAVHIPTTDDFRADVDAAGAAVTPNTILMVGSAPQYPHGVIDPIEELASIASGQGIPFHVDACLGGFLLPWVRKLGHDLPAFDFSVPGVTSLSADLHKYGYAARGASTVLYRNEEYRKHQFFAYTDWPGGLYGSPSMAGSRPGGAIAAAWAALKFLGTDGYLDKTRSIMETTRKLRDGIESIEGLRVLGNPHMSVFAFTADDVDVYAVGDAMKDLGWEIDAQQLPAALHLMVTPSHAACADDFLDQLRTTVARVRTEQSQSSTGISAMYGMAGAMPDRGPLEEMIVSLMGQLLPARG